VHGETLSSVPSHELWGLSSVKVWPKRARASDRNIRLAAQW